MAQTARQVHEVSVGESPANQAAMVSAARDRNMRVHDNVLYIWVPGHGLAPVPVIPGFAGLPEKFQPFALQCLVQGLRYRIGQGLSGKSAANALREAIFDGSVPKAKDNDSFLDAFEDYISRAVAAQMGDLPDKPSKDASAEDQAAYAKLVEDRKVTVAATVAKYLPKNEGGKVGALPASGMNLWDAAISEAIAAGEEIAGTRESKRAPAKAKTEGAAEL